MLRRFRRTCPVCGRPDLKNISTHLLQVHGLSSEERKPYRKQAPVSSWQSRIERSPHITMSYINVEKPGQKRVKQSEHSPPAKRPRTAARTTSLATKSCPEFNFRHKFSLLVVGPTQSGKTYFVQQILKHNRIVYEEQKSIRIFWYYNQWQECYEKLKKSLGKSIRFDRGAPELSEINARYNIIILDDLMAETTDSPVVSQLFTQGRHRNASVILLLQNMFPKGKYNTDISRNAQYLALFRSPSDRKQIGIIAERMFMPGTPPDNQILADLFGECYA